MVMNKSLQVCLSDNTPLSLSLTLFLGGQHPEHECRACRANVQELSIKRAIPLGGYVFHLVEVSSDLINANSHGKLEGPIMRYTLVDAFDDNAATIDTNELVFLAIKKTLKCNFSCPVICNEIPWISLCSAL